MFDKYMVCEETLHNVVEDGAVTGYAFEVRITYYRGLRLSMVEPFEVVVDGAPVPVEDLRFTLGGARTYTFAEMADEIGDRWEFGERALLTVRKPGGLAAGEHTLDVIERLRISYMPVLSEARCRKTAVVA
ncbi:DUF6379 domain-containing protein [Actinoplanes sp. NPDC051851]|uniref:C-glycoside deglycosidase beta subunit domain-containing protein n=1 Tax=Actinoplanes sp. NPDC051851 TaxID=3154753 RepID=UPI0034446B07